MIRVRCDLGDPARSPKETYRRPNLKEKETFRRPSRLEKVTIDNYRFRFLSFYFLLSGGKNFMFEITPFFPMGVSKKITFCS